METIFENKGGDSDQWAASLRLIKQKTDEVRSFVLYIKDKINSMNIEHQLLALDLIDFFIDQGTVSLHSQIGSKEFIGKLINLLKSRDAPKVQVKILRLIKKWGEKFEKSKDILPNFSITYKNLVNSGIDFPSDTGNDYLKYIESNPQSQYKEPSYEKPEKKEDKYYYANKDKGKDKPRSKNYNTSNNYGDIKETGLVEDKCVKFNPNDFRKKYRKFVEELNVLVENVQLANQMIDSSQVGAKPDDGLSMIMLNLKGCEQNLMNAIHKQISDEILLGICLKVNDDLNQTSERFNLLKAGAKPVSFTSAFGWGTQPEKSSKPKTQVSDKRSSSTSKSYAVRKGSYKDVAPGENKDQGQGQEQSQSVNKSEDIFDFFGGGNTGSNSNSNTNNIGMGQSKIPFDNDKNSAHNQNKGGSTFDINDIISSFNKVDTGNNTNTNNAYIGGGTAEPIFNFTSKNSNSNVNVPSTSMFDSKGATVNKKPDITELLNSYNVPNSNVNNNMNNMNMGQGQPMPNNNNMGMGQTVPMNNNMGQPNNNMNNNMNPYGYNPNPTQNMGGYGNPPQYGMNNMGQGQGQPMNNMNYGQVNNMGGNMGGVQQPPQNMMGNMNQMQGNLGQGQGQIPNQGYNYPNSGTGGNVGFNLNTNTQSGQQKDSLGGINPFA